jgi:hypothetical protein
VARFTELTGLLPHFYGAALTQRKFYAVVGVKYLFFALIYNL